MYNLTNSDHDRHEYMISDGPELTQVMNAITNVQKWHRGPVKSINFCRHKFRPSRDKKNALTILNSSRWTNYDFFNTSWLQKKNGTPSTDYFKRRHRILTNHHGDFRQNLPWATHNVPQRVLRKVIRRNVKVSRRPIKIRQTSESFSGSWSNSRNHQNKRFTRKPTSIPIFSFSASYLLTSRVTSVSPANKMRR